MSSKDTHSVEYWKNVAETQARLLEAEAAAHVRTTEKLKDTKDELTQVEHVRKGAVIAILFLVFLTAIESLAILIICLERTLLK